MKTLWDERYALRTQRMKSSIIRELLKFMDDPLIISFAGGMPAPESFPVKQFTDACQAVMTKTGPQALQYGATEGFTPLRELIAQQASRQGIQATADNVLITSGSQQALDLIGKIFINEGDHILVENPTYMGALQAWNVYGAEFLPVPIDHDGICIDGFETALRASPKLIYLLPNFQNPTGVSLSRERREKVVELADEYGIPIVEDDPYGRLRYEGEFLPSLQILDCQKLHNANCQSGNVIYLSTFSKLLSPGIRLAWVIAPPEVIRKLVTAKQGTDLHTSTFNQMVAYEVAKDGFLDQHIPTICDIYRERRQVMLDALQEHMPEGVTWTHPEGGLFLWMTLPANLSALDLFQYAIERKVAFVPGAPFYPMGGGESSLRLNYSNASPQMINEGIGRLGQAVKTFLARAN